MATEFQFPKECSGCKKKLGSEDYDEFYSVYQCRKEHWIVCCTVDCQRLLDKRCSKVSEGLRKMQHKLNNDGHTSALRRLPPCEREKLKQYQEAENNGLLICPTEMKAADRSVPFCSHAMERKGGYGKQTADGKDVPPEEEEASFCLDEGESSRTLGLAEDTLVNDDMLLELKKDDEDGDETTTSNKQKKGSKVKSQKQKKNIITLDWQTPAHAGVQEQEEEDYHEALSAPPAAKAAQAAWTGGISGTAVSQAWNAASNDRRMQATGPTPSPTTLPGVPAPVAQRPADMAQRTSMLMSTTGCTEIRAKELLEQNQYRLESAADAYFRQESNEPEPANDSMSGWGRRAGGPAQGGQGFPPGPNGQVHQQDEQAAEEAVAQAPLAPSQPPPPPMPPNWQALWNEEQEAYYFWHVPTNAVSWDPPPAEENREAPGAEEQARLQVSNSTGLDPTAAGELLESNGWNVQRAIKSHSDAEERRRRELEARRQQEERVARAAAEEEARVRQLEAERERQRLEEGELDSFPRQRDLPAHCTINQHWRSKDDQPACIRVLKGERVLIDWMDGRANGWVYGSAVDDKDKKGYLPRAILDKVLRTPGPHSVGSVYGVRDTFKGPDETGGYLSVEPGDHLKVLHPVDSPYVWAFAELVKSNNGSSGRDDLGWVPEDILCDL